MAIGPFVGGYLVQAWSWRLIFFINVPLALAVVVIARRYVPETRDPAAPRRLDVAGAALAAIGLGGITYALIELPVHGARRGRRHRRRRLGAGRVGRRCSSSRRERAAPMLDLRSSPTARSPPPTRRRFVIYAALGGAFFLLPIDLQQVLGYSPLAAGAALLPSTVMMLLLSASMGRLAQRIGPRVPLTVGPLVAAVGLLLLVRIGAGAAT